MNPTECNTKGGGVYFVDRFFWEGVVGGTPPAIPKSSCLLLIDLLYCAQQVHVTVLRANRTGVQLNSLHPHLQRCQTLESINTAFRQRHQLVSRYLTRPRKIQVSPSI